MTTIATICARGDSKGLPGKNIKNLLGKPLIAYSIEQALQAKEIDAVYCSTDSQQIADIAQQYGAIIPALRPKELADDHCSKLDVINHLVALVKPNHNDLSRIIDLDVTSPLRDIIDITACVELLDDETDLVITGYEADKNPYFNMVEYDEYGSIKLVKPPLYGVTGRQRAPKVYAMNASIYAWHASSLHKGLWSGKVKLHEMPRSRSIDIDDEIDFELVEYFMRKKIKSE